MKLSLHQKKAFREMHADHIKSLNEASRISTAEALIDKLRGLQKEISFEVAVLDSNLAAARKEGRVG